MTTPEQWLERLDDTSFQKQLESSCGYSSDDWSARAQVWRTALQGFLERFGSKPVFIARCPGRVNLRGMHVDTHGGFLNVMTHQRETLVAAAPAPDSVCTCVNADPAFPEFSFRPDAEPDPHGHAWETFLGTDEVKSHVQPLAGTWGLYARGCAQSLRARTQSPAHAIEAFVASDLPRGAALSASHALCVAMLLAFERASTVELSKHDRILAARDAEWYAGARTGTSDQAAMILGAQNTMLAGPLPPSDLDLSRLRKIPWPRDLSLVVTQSFTARSLSGADRVAYTANRFAYSLALDILRDVLEVEDRSVVHLYQFTEDRFSKEHLLDALLRVPERLSMDALQARCRDEVFDEAYQRYFGNLDENERPRIVPLRGPLLFGIAESERARRFAVEIRCGRHSTAGALMTIGHAGDRKRDAEGKSWQYQVDDSVLRDWKTSHLPLCTIPGAYGASSPALDAIVDAALDAGAYGASLTGAGIAGVVLALCPRDAAEDLVKSLRGFLTSAEYAQTAGLDVPLSDAQAETGIVVNRAPAAASVVG